MRIYLLASSEYAALAVFVRGALRHNDHDVILHTFSQAAQSETLIKEADIVVPLLDRSAPTLPEVYQMLRLARQYRKIVLGLTVEPLPFKLKGASLIDIGNDPAVSINHLLGKLSTQQIVASTHHPFLSIPAMMVALLLVLATIFLMLRPYLMPDEIRLASLPTYVPTYIEADVSISVTTSSEPVSDAIVLHDQTSAEGIVTLENDYRSSTVVKLNANPQTDPDALSPTDSSELSTLVPDGADMFPTWSGNPVPTTATSTFPSSNISDDKSNIDEAVASIFANPTTGTAPLTVTFENDSLGTITSYAWDFNGDGVIDSAAKNPQPYTYSEPGFYRVSLNVIGPNGEGFPDEIVIIVFEPLEENLEPTATIPANTNRNDDSSSVLNDEPVASFLTNPSSGNAPLTVTFENDTLGQANSYAWDFNGDGVTDSTAKNPQPYTYATDGSYRPKLTVTGAGGYTDTFTSSVIVFASVTAGTPPEARFTVNPKQGRVPLRVTLINQSIGDILTYRWDFNADGIADSTQAVPNPLTFNRAGIYTISLVVAGPDGISDPFLETIDVLPMATATLTVTATSTPSATATLTATPVPTETATTTMTASPTQSVTATAVPVPTETATSTPSATTTATTTPVPNETVPSTVTASSTPSPTATLTATPVPTETVTVSSTQTVVETSNPDSNGN